MAIGRPVSLTSNVASKSISVTAIADQTLFTVTGGYRINQLAVFRNGLRLVDGSEYSARDGSTVSLVSAASAGDVLQFQIFDDFRVANAIQADGGDQSVNGSFSASGGFNVGIQSGGTDIATGVITAINFLGVGNTFLYDSSTKIVDISLAGAGAGGTWATYDSETGITTSKKVRIQNDLQVTGVTTSTGGFVGALTGNVTGNISGTTGSFSGNVSVGGTLTYEDVTNIDSVGLITARTGINIVGGGLTVTGVSTFFGNTRILDDVEFHVGTNGSIGEYKYYRDSGNTLNVLYEDISGAEARFISNLAGDSNAAFHFFKASTALARFSVNSTQLYSGGDAKFDTTGGGVSITGTSTCTGSVQVGSGQSFGSSGASAAVYYGDGSNLTGIEAASFLFNTGVSSSVTLAATGIGTTALTLPSTSGKQYIVHSILASNVSTGNTEVNFVGAFDFNGGQRSYFAKQIPIPTGMSVEMLRQPQVLNPSDVIMVRSTDFNRNGTDDIIDVFISYEEKTSTDLVGVGLGTVGIADTSAIGIFTSTSNPSVIQSIRLANVTDAGGKIANVIVSGGSTDRFLVENLVVPKYSSIEVLDNLKRIETNQIIKIQIDEASTIDVQLSAKKITS